MITIPFILIAISRVHHGLGFAPYILRKGVGNGIRLLELTFLTTPHATLVSAGLVFRLSSFPLVIQSQLFSQSVNSYRCLCLGEIVVK